MNHQINKSHKNRLTTQVKIQLEKKIERLYVNRELIQFFKVKILHKTKEEQLDWLRFFKIAILQTSRSPDPDHKAAFEDEYAAEKIAIAEDQIQLNPLLWIETKMDDIKAKINRSVEQERRFQENADAFVQQPSLQQMLIKEKFMEVMSMPLSTLNKRISEGLPCHKFGKATYFIMEEVVAHIKSKSAA